MMEEKRGRGRPKGSASKRSVTWHLNRKLTPEEIADSLIDVMKNGKPKEKLEAADRIMALRGDTKDKNSGAALLANAGPVMVIIGASEERMKSLRTAEALPTAEELEEERAARAEQRLKLLREGSWEPGPSKSKARKDEVELPDVESRPAGPDSEDPPREG